MRIEELKKAKDQRTHPGRSVRSGWPTVARSRIRTPRRLRGGEHGRIVSYISPADEWEVIDIALVTSLGSVPAQPTAGDKGDVA